MNRFVLALSLFMISAVVPALPALATAPRASYLHYEGTMDGVNIPFALDLLFEGSKCEGSWYRKDRGAWAVVQGTRASNGGLALIERNGEGREVARFTLRRTAPGEYAGTWRGTPAGEGRPRSLRVSLREVLSAAASLRGVSLREKAYSRSIRRSRNSPKAEFTFVGPEAVALSYGSSAEAIAELKRTLLDFVADTAGLPPGTALSDHARQARDRFFGEYRAMEEEMAGEGFPETAFEWFEAGRSFVRLNECYLLVVERTRHVYHGGAHPEYYSHYGIFDLHTGRRLTRDALFVAGAVDRLRPLLKRKALAEMSERTGEAVDEEFLLYEGEFPVTENIYLRRDGVVFHYNVYEMAAYYMGDFDIVLTWDELRGLLRPNTPAGRLLPGAPQGDAR